MDSEPECCQEVELEAREPLVLSLYRVNCLDCLFLLADKDESQGWAPDIARLQHLVNDLLLTHVYVHWDFQKVFFSIRDRMHLLVSNSLHVDFGLLVADGSDVIFLLWLSALAQSHTCLLACKLLQL